MTFQETIPVLKNHIDDLEVELKRLEEKKVKSSGSKARALLLKIKTLAHEMRKQVLIDVKQIPVKKSKKKVAIRLPEEDNSPAEEVPIDPPMVEEPKVEEPKVKKARGRPKKLLSN